MYTIDHFLRQRFFLRLKKLGLFKYLPRRLDVAERYFKNMKEEDFVVKKADIKKAPDLLATAMGTPLKGANTQK